MKKIRRKIIACLDLKNGKVVKGINFENIKEMGDPVDLAKKYQLAGADELVLLDISKTQDKHEFRLDLIEKISAEITIPLVVGGGVSSLDDINKLLEAGASKVSIASAALENPDLIKKAVQRFGSDKIIVAFDVQLDSETDTYYIYTHGASKKTNQEVFSALEKFDILGAGAFLITGIDFDGRKDGFDIEFYQLAEQVTKKPLIASGGAGQINDFLELFSQTNIEYALAASIFHQNLVDIAELKAYLRQNGLNVRERDE